MIVLILEAWMGSKLYFIDLAFIGWRKAEIVLYAIEALGGAQRPSHFSSVVYYAKNVVYM